MRESTVHVSAVREFDGRVSDGIHARLLWRPADGRVSVSVSDSKTGEAFEVPVRAGERALEVFPHPYAYAASRELVSVGQADGSLAA